MTSSRLGTLVLVFFIVAVLLVSARLEPAALNPLVYGLTVGAWLFLGLVIRPTLKRPRIGALSERTFVGFVIALLGTISSVIVYNVDHDRILFDAQTSALLFREAIIAILLIPSIWIVLFLAGKLGQAADRSAALDRLEAQGHRIEEALTDNTRISQEASNHADAAYHEANTVNEKLAAQGREILEQDQGERSW